MRQGGVSNADDESISDHLVPHCSVVTGVCQCVELRDVFFGGFSFPLVLSVESCSLVDDVPPYLEVAVELSEDGVVGLALFFRDACGCEDVFRFLSDAVEESADLLRVLGGTESGCDAIVLEVALPSRPVVGVPEVEGLGGLKVKCCHSPFGLVAHRCHHVLLSLTWLRVRLDN